jgi:hypothetical protein
MHTNKDKEYPNGNLQGGPKPKPMPKVKVGEEGQERN